VGFAGDRAAGPGADEKQGEAGQAAPGGAPAKYRADERAIIYTGSITVRVEDVDAAARQATSVATGAGGFVGGDKRTSDDDSSYASLTLRVPADRFGTVVDALAGLGDEEARQVDTDDVTEEVVDLDARIATQRARVDSGRRLLAEAKSLSDLVMLERELATREADLAALEAKKRRLADLTALSTITLELLGPQARVEEDEIGFLAGLRAGWRAFVASLEVLVTVLGALLPWLLAIGIPVTLVAWSTRRINRRRAGAGHPPGDAAAALVTRTTRPASATGPSSAIGPSSATGPVAAGTAPPPPAPRSAPPA
jgi:hypothetical protein